MRAVQSVAAALLMLLAAQTLSASAAGIFRGFVVEAPPAEARSGWIYVNSPNGMMRRVKVSRAHVFYAQTVPLSLRKETPAKSLVNGTEIRVTAEQDGDGEWNASEIEILRLRRHPKRGRT
jgi:hypothetical protein